MKIRSILILCAIATASFDCNANRDIKAWAVFNKIKETSKSFLTTTKNEWNNIKNIPGNGWYDKCTLVTIWTLFGGIMVSSVTAAFILGLKHPCDL